MTITIELPWPPTVNSYWRHPIVNGQRRSLISKAGRAYRNDVWGAWLQCSDRCAQPITHTVKVDLAVYPPDRRRRDLDNLPKAVFDSLTHVGVWADDSLVDDFRVHRESVNAPGRVVVTISGMSNGIGCNPT